MTSSDAQSNPVESSLSNTLEFHPNITESAPSCDPLVPSKNLAPPLPARRRRNSGGATIVKPKSPMTSQYASKPSRSKHSNIPANEQTAFSRENSSDSLRTTPHVTSSGLSKNSTTSAQKAVIIDILVNALQSSQPELVEKVLGGKSHVQPRHLAEKIENTSNDSELCAQEEMGGGTPKKDGVGSKIPVFRRRGFESSNESIEMPSPPPVSLITRPKKHLHKNATALKQDRGKEKKKERIRLDSSGSESNSPQISPSNTSSGVSLSGTTGSESSATERAQRTPEEGSLIYRARAASLDIDLQRPSPTTRKHVPVASKSKLTSDHPGDRPFAAARKINLTKPTPFPQPPASLLLAQPRSSTHFKHSRNATDEAHDSGEKSENETSKTLTPSQSNNSQDSVDGAVIISKPEVSHDVTPETDVAPYMREMTRFVTREERQAIETFEFRRTSSAPSLKAHSVSQNPQASAPSFLDKVQRALQRQLEAEKAKNSSKAVTSQRQDSKSELENKIDLNETFTVDEGTADNPVNLPKENTIENAKSKSKCSDVTELDRGRPVRSSYRVPRRRSKERTGGKEKRSLSVGAVMRKLNHQRKTIINSQAASPKEASVAITSTAVSTKAEKAALAAAEKAEAAVIRNKPPKPPSGRSPSTGRSPSAGRSPVREEEGKKPVCRRRTLSEQVCSFVKCKQLSV